MAARIRKHHQDEVRARFYVYDVLDSQGSIIYIGKGSGRRAQVSCRERGGDRFKIAGWFDCEKEAYRHEVARIAEHRPLLNKHPGGNGPCAPKSRFRKDNWQRAFESVGSQRYTARLLLACVNACKRAGSEYPGELSKVDAIREVAYG